MSNLFLLRLDSSAIPYWLNPVSTFGGDVWKLNIGVGTNVAMEFNTLAVAVHNNDNLNVSWYSEPFNSTFGPNFETFLGFRLYMYFPIFNGSLFYDPGMLK